VLDRLGPGPTKGGEKKSSWKPRRKGRENLKKNTRGGKQKTEEIQPEGKNRKTDTEIKGEKRGYVRKKVSGKKRSSKGLEKQRIEILVSFEQNRGREKAVPQELTGKRAGWKKKGDKRQNGGKKMEETDQGS